MNPGDCSQMATLRKFAFDFHVPLFLAFCPPVYICAHVLTCTLLPGISEVPAVQPTNNVTWATKCQ